MEGYVGEIRPFAFGFTPRGWAPCNGAILPISQNAALFSLLSTNFGGDGRTTFGLPDLRGRAVVGAGKVAGDQPSLSYDVGKSAGVEQVELTEAQYPTHAHYIWATEASGTTGLPKGAYFATPSNTGKSPLIPIYTKDAEALVSLRSSTVSTVGNSGAHTNMQPYAVVNFCICVSGQYPGRP